MRCHQPISAPGVEVLSLTPQQRQVIEYFTDTHNDYRRLWGSDRHLGLHCGFHDVPYRCHDDAVAHMNRVLAARAEITTADRVLDAGCGIGGSAIWLARNIGCRVVGVNIHPAQIEQARQLALRHEVASRVQFRLADFCLTGLAESSFDVVWALESMCYAEDKRAFIAEAKRLLKPGGRLVIADAFLTHEPLLSDEQQIVEHWRKGWAIPNVVGGARFEAWLREAGLGQIRFLDITTQVTPSSRRIYLASILFYSLGLMLHWLGLRSALQTRGIASGFHQYHLLRRGIGIYGIFLAERSGCAHGASQTLTVSSSTARDVGPCR